MIRGKGGCTATALSVKEECLAGLWCVLLLDTWWVYTQLVEDG